MIAAVDASVLMHLIDPNLAAAIDPSTGQPTDRCAERIDFLVRQFAKSSDRLVIPTPTLSECLVYAGAKGPQWLAALSGKRAVTIAPFDECAAVECAAMARQRAAKGRTSPRNKAKFDEQIVAIAIVNGASVIYSDDDDIHRLAPADISVIRVADLPLPPTSGQAVLPWGDV